jgi:hypothetical protein
MKYILTALTAVLTFGFNANAQTIKTDVLVFGGTASGVAAAIQASRSGVKTILIFETAQLGADIKGGNTSFPAGIWAEFSKRVKEAKKDSNAITDPATTASVLKGIIDTVKNLTVRYNSGLRKIEKDGKGWEVKLTDTKSSIKAFAVIDATAKSDIAAAANVNYDSKTKSYLTIVPAAPLTELYSNNLYRTSVGVGADLKTGAAYSIPLGALVAEGQNNFFLTGKLAAVQSSADAMFTGQAAGASAAYCAFFKATTKEFNENAIRVTQGELLNYKSVLVPYTDIKKSDVDFMTLQHIGLTGILKAKQTENELLFMPDSTISTGEIRSAFKEYYSRSQIWFLDKKADKLTLGDALSLIKYSGSRGDELNKQVEKGWKESFGFAGKYDLAQPVTRRQFAVLLENFLKPFNVRVNLQGGLGS